MLRNLNTNQFLKYHSISIFFCAPLLRQLPLCSPLCHSLFTEKSILDGGSHVFLLMLLRISARV